MINFGLNQFMLGRQFLWQERLQSNAESIRNPHERVPKSLSSRIENSIMSAIRYTVVPLQLEALNKVSIDLENLVKNYESQPYTWSQLNKLLDRFWEDLEYESEQECFFHYSREDARRLGLVDGEWKDVILAFGSSRPEILAAVDCFALGHNTASVFHMMRVAEIGLRALARERGVSFPRHPIEWADWQNILEQTEAKAKDATRNMARGPAKDAALAFYSGAIGQLHAFKDTYRNAVMHVRRSYDQLDALRAINQVRDFMNGLSAKIGEKTRRPIRRWP